MTNRILLFLLTGLLSACGEPPMWVVEDQTDTAVITQRGDTTEIVAPSGLTLWHPQHLSGDYRISYTARMIIDGGAHDRLSDLNCFWAARDPKNPEKFFTRTLWRDGIFHNYNSLDLFYVGFGGNENTTTRFRRYYGEHFGVKNAEVKPLIAEYTDSTHLLSPNRDYHIVISVAANRTSYSVNGEELFTRTLKPGEGEGYFGLRLLENHTLIYGFKIEYR